MPRAECPLGAGNTHTHRHRFIQRELHGHTAPTRTTGSPVNANVAGWTSGALSSNARRAYTTDFVACIRCKTMFFVPLPPVVVVPRAPGSIGHGGPFDGRSVPPRESDDKLKRDAAEAAKDYVKPGRHAPPRQGRK
jgi:hypothetical protein